MNPPFPKEAECVRQKIRELVVRPKELPKTVGWDDNETRLRWEGAGFCPWFKIDSPNRRASLPINKVLGKFFEWWDNCTDAQQAVNTVWGDKK